MSGDERNPPGHPPVDGMTPSRRPARARDIDAVAADFLASRDSGAWTSTQEETLQAWLDQSSLHRVAFLRLDSAWQRADRLQVHRYLPTAAAESSSPPPSPALRPVARTARATARHRRWAKLLPRGIAAGLLLALGVGFGMTAFGPGAESPWDSGQMHATAVGERAVITLSDGTRITLNTATRLRAEMGEHARHVWLDHGEAYFEVAHDATRPFIIDAGGPSVRVLGTKFTLRREEAILQTHVVEGRVEVSAPTGAVAELVADEAAEATASSVKVRRETSAQRDAGMSWLQGTLRLEGMTLDEAAREFNRYNRRKLKILDRSTGSIRIGGAFDTTNVEGFARLLESGFGLEVQAGAKEITVGAAKLRSQ